MGEGSFIPEPYFVNVGTPMEEDVEMMHPEVLGTDLFCFEDEDGLDGTC